MIFADEDGSNRNMIPLQNIKQVYKIQTRSMLDRTNSKSSLNSKDYLQQRAEQLAKLINRNNHQFNKGMPSQHQLSALLEHTSDCFDQLAFLEHQQATQQMVGTLNKQMHKQRSTIFNSSKTFFKNINSWIGGFEVELLKKIKNKQVYENELANYKNSCKICHNHVEEVVIRQAKKQIVGPMNWRQLFDEELMNEKQEATEPFEPPEQKEYVGSVNYLTRVIQEMQESIQGYENVAHRIEKDHMNKSQERTLKLLEELVLKVKNKMGQRCLPKMQQILKKELLKTNGAFRTPHPQFVITEQLSYCLGNSKKSLVNRPISNDIVIAKLKEENKRLTIEKNAVTELYHTAQIHLSSAEQQIHQAKNISNFARKNQKSDSIRTEQVRKLPHNNISLNKLATESNQDNNRSSMNTEQSNTNYQQKFQRIAMIPHLMNRPKGSMLMKKISTFASQTGYTRQSELANIFDQSLQEYPPRVPEQEDIYHNSYEQEDEEVQKGSTKEVGCQWDLSDLLWDSTDTNEARSSHKRIKSSKKFMDSSLQKIPQNSRSVSNKNILKFGSPPPKTSNAAIRTVKKIKTKDKNGNPQKQDQIIEDNPKQNHKPSGFKHLPKQDKGLSKQQRKRKAQTSKEIRSDKTTYFISKKHKDQQYALNKSKTSKLQEMDSHTNSNNVFPQQITNSFSYSNLNNLSMSNFDLTNFLNSEQCQAQNIGMKKSTLDQLRLKLQRYNTTEDDGNPFYRNGMLKGQGLDNIKAERHTMNHLNRNGKELSNKLQPIIEHDSILISSNQIASQPQIKDGSLNLKDDGLSKNIRKKKNKKNNLNRNVTEGNQRKQPKNKPIRNFLFQTQHLFLFGGLSQSYNYQLLPYPNNDEQLSEQDKTFLKKMLSYLSNLKGFKRNIYENIVSFLKSPWEVIDKNECEFLLITNQMLYNIVMKLLTYHKKKCLKIPCEHLTSFAQIIGLII